VGTVAITELILELKRRGKTVLLCSHLLAQVEGVCDHLAILNQGKLVAQGSVSDLLRREGLSSLAVENFSPGARTEVEAALGRHGARLLYVDEARVSLDRLFVEKIAPETLKEKPAAPEKGKAP